MTWQIVKANVIAEAQPAAIVVAGVYPTILQPVFMPVPEPAMWEKSLLI